MMAHSNKDISHLIRNTVHSAMPSIDRPGWLVQLDHPNPSVFHSSCTSVLALVVKGRMHPKVILTCKYMIDIS